MDHLGLETVEVSDGSMVIEEDAKCEMINRLSKKFRVLSEVGSKEAGILISPNKWTTMMEQELAAGSWKSDCRSSGKWQRRHLPPQRHRTHRAGASHLAKVALEDILWEAPKSPNKCGS